MVNREVQVVVNQIPVSFLVPPDCSVLLNGERVKLRLLQPTDRVEVFYGKDSQGLLTARRIEACAGHSSVSKARVAI